MTRAQTRTVIINKKYYYIAVIFYSCWFLCTRFRFSDHLFGFCNATVAQSVLTHIELTEGQFQMQELLINTIVGRLQSDPNWWSLFWLTVSVRPSGKQKHATTLLVDHWILKVCYYCNTYYCIVFHIRVFYFPSCLLAISLQVTVHCWEVQYCFPKNALK